MAVLIASAQAEDYMRQRHEHLIFILEAMVNTIEKIGSKQDQELIADLKVNVLEKLNMHDLHGTLADALGVKAEGQGSPSPVNYAEGNDVELF